MIIAREQIDFSRITSCLKENYLALGERTLTEKISTKALFVLAAVGTTMALSGSPTLFIGAVIIYASSSPTSPVVGALRTLGGSYCLIVAAKTALLAVTTLNPATALISLFFFSTAAGCSLPTAKENLFYQLPFSGRKAHQEAVIQYELTATATISSEEEILAYQKTLVETRDLFSLNIETLQFLAKHIPDIYTEDFLKENLSSLRFAEIGAIEPAILKKDQDLEEWNSKARTEINRGASLNNYSLYMGGKALYDISKTPKNQRAETIETLKRLNQPSFRDSLRFSDKEWFEVLSALNFPLIRGNINETIELAMNSCGLYTEADLKNTLSFSLKGKTLWDSAFQRRESLCRGSKPNLSYFINDLKTLAFESNEPRARYQVVFHHAIKLTTAALWIALNPIPTIAGIAFATLSIYFKIELETHVSSLTSKILPIDQKLEHIAYLTFICGGFALLAGAVGYSGLGAGVGYLQGLELSEYISPFLPTHSLEG